MYLYFTGVSFANKILIDKYVYFELNKLKTQYMLCSTDA